ncbi:MAG: hypothetical protein HY731_10980 [Candidatus Tectomicrobia bacterium]|nr:hypothetical protein [Candidatus Tectomicrobia bacterium]
MSQYPHPDVQEEIPEPISAIGNDLDGNMVFLVDMLEKENINGAIYAYQELKEIGMTEKEVKSALDRLQYGMPITIQEEVVNS